MPGRITPSVKTFCPLLKSATIYPKASKVLYNDSVPM